MKSIITSNDKSSIELRVNSSNLH